MYVYKITNKKDLKCYVGITESPVKRYRQHVRESKMERSNGRKLYQAIKDFGIENFQFEILEQTEDDTREKFWIAFFNSVENGYNHTKDGKGNRDIAEYVKNGGSQVYKNNLKHFEELTKDDIQKIKELYAQGFGVRAIRTKTNIADRTINKIVCGITRKRRKIVPRKTILKFDSDGKLIGTYLGIKEAKENCGYGKNGIIKVLLGQRKTAGGFYWKYDE